MRGAGQPACVMEGAQCVAEGLVADAQGGAQRAMRGRAVVAQEGEDAFGQRRRSGRAAEDLQVSAAGAGVCGVLGCLQTQ